MPHFAPKAHDTGRGRHPDLTESGEVRHDAVVTTDPDARDFDRMMADPTRQAHFMSRLAAAQSLEPPEVQQAIGGQRFEGTASQGYREYQAYRDYLRQVTAQNAGANLFVDDADLAQMSLEQYDALFDANGRPRSGVYYYPNRSVLLTDRIDPHSQRELGAR